MNYFIRTLFACLLLLVSLFSVSQENYNTKSKKAIKLFEEAVKNYKYQYYEQAFEMANAAIEEDEQFVDPYLLRAHMNLALGQSSKARGDFLKAIEINPDHDPRT